MSQTRLNNIAVLNCHRSYVEAVDIDNILDEFISKCTVRQNTFAMKSEISHSMRNTAQAAQHLEMQCIQCHFIPRTLLYSTANKTEYIVLQWIICVCCLIRTVTYLTVD